MGRKPKDKTPWPSLEFEEGYRACHRGVGRHRNPHTDKEKAAHWLKGWQARYYNDPSEEW